MVGAEFAFFTLDVFCSCVLPGDHSGPPGYSSHYFG